MNDTKIRWTEQTWNPFSGCTKVSPGCAFCYAHTLAEKKRGSVAFPKGFDLTLRPHKMREPYALKRASLIFVNSMSDLFLDEVPMAYRDAVVDVIEDCDKLGHQFQVLTKRADNLLAYSKRRRIPPNMWVGVSVEDQQRAERVRVLQEVDAEVRIISAEPLLGPIDFGDSLAGMSWLITGGESGEHLMDAKIREKRSLCLYEPKARKWHPHADGIGWVRSIRDQCLAHGVAFFHKQWGGYRPESAGHTLDGREWDQYPRLPDGSRFDLRRASQMSNAAKAIEARAREAAGLNQITVKGKPTPSAPVSARPGAASLFG